MKNNKIKWNCYDIDGNEAILKLDDKEVDRIDLIVLIDCFLEDSKLHQYKISK